MKTVMCRRLVLLSLAPHERTMVALYARYPCADCPLVVSVLGAKERDESVLLHQDSLLEESEAYHSVQKEADGIDQQHLKYINKK